MRWARKATLPRSLPGSLFSADELRALLLVEKARLQQEGGAPPKECKHTKKWAREQTENSASWHPQTQAAISRASPIRDRVSSASGRRLRKTPLSLVSLWLKKRPWRGRGRGRQGGNTNNTNNKQENKQQKNNEGTAGRAWASRPSRQEDLPDRKVTWTLEKAPKRCETRENRENRPRSHVRDHLDTQKHSKPLSRSLGRSKTLKHSEKTRGNRENRPRSHFEVT